LLQYPFSNPILYLALMNIKLIIKKLSLILFFLLSLQNISFGSRLHFFDKTNPPKPQAQSKKLSPKKMMALTIDDLPFVGEYRNFHLNMIIETLSQEKVPVKYIRIIGNYCINSAMQVWVWEIIQ
jgi:hypothetical protein